MPPWVAVSMKKGAFMAGLFGTDGVRARINTGSMTAEAVVRLALAAGQPDQTGAWLLKETYQPDRTELTQRREHPCNG